MSHKLKEQRAYQDCQYNILLKRNNFKQDSNTFVIYALGKPDSNTILSHLNLQVLLARSIRRLHFLSSSNYLYLIYNQQGHLQSDFNYYSNLNILTRNLHKQKQNFGTVDILDQYFNYYSNLNILTLNYNLSLLLVVCATNDI